jgi:hypothetical protein
MREWQAQGPIRSSYARVTLRLLAYAEYHHPLDGKQRFVVQVIDSGEPVAEDPIFEGRVTPDEIAEFIEASIDDGWRIAKQERLPHAAFATPLPME